MRPIPLTRPKPSSSMFLLLLASITAAAFSVLLMVDPMDKRPSAATPTRSPAGPRSRDARAEAHLAEAVAWLLRHQASDGSWRGSERMTALAVLALAETGADPAATRKGVDALLRDPQVRAPATLAVARAAALLYDSGYKTAANRMARELLGRAKIVGGDSEETGWVGDALWAAREIGSDIDFDAVGREIRTAFDAVTDAEGRVLGKNGAGSHETLVAVGLNLRLQIGMDSGAPVLAMAVQRLSCDLPVGSSADFLYWYQGTQALLQCRQSQPAVWAKWSERVVRLLVEHQKGEGSDKGSWDPHAKEEGRVEATALNAVTLARILRHRSSIAIEQD